MLYGGKILYICYMVDCTGGAITWQMQCQAHAVKATMDDFFWWKLQVQIQLQIFCTKFNANKITSNNFCMTIPVIVIVIYRNVRKRKVSQLNVKARLGDTQVWCTLIVTLNMFSIKWWRSKSVRCGWMEVVIELSGKVKLLGLSAR